MASFLVGTAVNLQVDFTRTYRVLNAIGAPQGLVMLGADGSFDLCSSVLAAWGVWHRDHMPADWQLVPYTLDDFFAENGTPEQPQT